MHQGRILVAVTYPDILKHDAITKQQSISKYYISVTDITITFLNNITDISRRAFINNITDEINKQVWHTTETSVTLVEL